MEITLEDFKKFVRNRPRPDTPGFYKLWRLRCKGFGYKRHDVELMDNVRNIVIKGSQWRFPIKPFLEMEYEYYPTFDEAYSAMMKPSCIDSNIMYQDPELNYTFGYQISRLGFGPHGTNDFYIEYHRYDSMGREYDRSSCSSYHWNMPGIFGKFLGRFPDEIAFKDGDLVEIGISRYEDAGKEYSVLGVVIGIPLTVEEIYEKVGYYINEQGGNNPIDSYYEEPDMCGVDGEEYFILYGPFDDSLRYTAFRHPSEVRPPSFEVPKEAKETIMKYYEEYLNSIKDEN